MTAPRDLADAQARLDATEAALAGLMHENNELRAIIRRVREYAGHQRQYGTYIHNLGTAADRYAALPYFNTAAALERIVGDKP